MTNQSKPIQPLDNEQRKITLDANSVDTGIALGKRVAETKGYSSWVQTIILGALLLLNVFIVSGNSDPNIELINERLTQEFVKPYVEQIEDLKITITDLQTEVIELKSENEVLVSTNIAYSNTIVSLQEQLKLLEND